MKGGNWRNVEDHARGAVGEGENETLVEAGSDVAVRFGAVFGVAVLE